MKMKNNLIAPFSLSPMCKRQDRFLYKKSQGVYFLFHKGKIVYIGITNNICSRLGMHTDKIWTHFCFIKETHDDQRRRLEDYLIFRYKPKYNDETMPESIYWENKTRRALWCIESFMNGIEVHSRLKTKPEDTYWTSTINIFCSYIASELWQLYHIESFKKSDDPKERYCKLHDKYIKHYGILFKIYDEMYLNKGTYQYDVYCSKSYPERAQILIDVFNNKDLSKTKRDLLNKVSKRREFIGRINFY